MCLPDSYLWHLNVNTPKDNLVCLSLGTTSFYYGNCLGLNFHNVYSYSLIYLRPGQKNRYTNVILQLIVLLFLFSLWSNVHVYIALFIVENNRIFIYGICHDYISQQESTLHVFGQIYVIEFHFEIYFLIYSLF